MILEDPHKVIIKYLDVVLKVLEAVLEVLGNQSKALITQ